MCKRLCNQFLKMLHLLVLFHDFASIGNLSPNNSKLLFDLFFSVGGTSRLHSSTRIDLQWQNQRYKSNSFASQINQSARCLDQLIRCMKKKSTSVHKAAETNGEWCTSSSHFCSYKTKNTLATILTVFEAPLKSFKRKKADKGSKSKSSGTRFSRNFPQFQVRLSGQ